MSRLKSTADAKKVMSMRDRNFRLREDTNPISISVPRRFFQLISNTVRRGSAGSGPYTVPAQNGQTDDRDGRKITRLSTQDGVKETGAADTVVSGVKSVYSPQDARSDLRKKREEKPSSNDAGLTGSPKVYQQRCLQNSPTRKNIGKKGGGVTPKKASRDGVAAGDAIVDAPSTATITAAIAVSNEKSTGNAASGPIAPTFQDTLELANIEAPAVLRPSAASFDTGPVGTMESSTLQTGNEPVAPECGSADIESNFQLNSTPVTSSTSKSVMTPSVIQQLAQDSLDGKDQSMKFLSSHNSGHLVTDKKSTTDAGSIAELVEEPTERLSDSNVTDQEVALSNVIPIQVPDKGPTPPVVHSLSTTEIAEDSLSHKMMMPCLAPKSALVSVGDAPAKSGVLQATSLHPYAKPSKYQQKRAKEALRKQLKKEQADRTGKAKTKSENSNACMETNEAAVPSEEDVGSQHSTKPVPKGNEGTLKHEGENDRPILLADAAVVANSKVHKSQGSTFKNSQDTSHTPAPTSDPGEFVSDEQATLAPKKNLKNKRKKVKPTLFDEDKLIVEDAHGKGDPITTESDPVTCKAINFVTNPNQELLTESAVALAMAESDDVDNPAAAAAAPQPTNAPSEHSDHGPLSNPPSTSPAVLPPCSSPSFPHRLTAPPSSKSLNLIKNWSMY